MRRNTHNHYVFTHRADVLVSGRSTIEIDSSVSYPKSLSRSSSLPPARPPVTSTPCRAYSYENISLEEASESYIRFKNPLCASPPSTGSESLDDSFPSLPHLNKRILKTRRKRSVAKPKLIKKTKKYDSTSSIQELPSI